MGWYYGKDNQLKGTARTLDAVDGECEIDDGIMSRTDISSIDDSTSFIIADDGWIEERSDKAAADIYIFAYADDYYAQLEAFYKLCGRTPLLPRYALGNMWSRYHRYTQEEYLSLMDRFKAEECPFSVAVIDICSTMAQTM